MLAQGPRAYTRFTASQYLQNKVQSGGVEIIWTEDIFIHRPSQNSMVLFWSTCYYRMRLQRNHTNIVQKAEGKGKEKTCFWWLEQQSHINADTQLENL